MKKFITKDSWKLEKLNRGHKLALSLIGVVFLAVISWLAGSKIQSPAEAAARTAPPTPSPILVPVEERVLTSNIITRGTARFGLPQTISLAHSSLKPDVGVVTTLPERDAQINEGQVLLTTSGRPVLLLQGDVPAYRDLFVGLSGEDVHQLEAALERLEFDPGAVDGVYDEQTSAAVTDLYASAGYAPFVPTGEQLTELLTLENELALASDKKVTAENALAQTADDARQAAEREVEWLTFLVDQLTQEVEAARHKAESPLPVDEIVFLPEFPVRVEEIALEVGDTASGPVMVVTNNQLAIDSSLPLAEAPLVKPGMVVTIDEPDLGLQATGVVSRIASAPGTDGVDGYHIYFEVLVDETPQTLEGFSLRLTIPVESTGGKVMVVPISALFLASDGTSRVQVENNGKLELVEVEPGLSADGFVQVTPIDGTLEESQLVLVGYENGE